RIAAISKATFAAVGACDYARVGLRVDAQERPYVIEVNPNPCISPTAGLALSAQHAGWDYDALVVRIVRNAERRGARAPLAARVCPARHRGYAACEPADFLATRVYDGAGAGRGRPRPTQRRGRLSAGGERRRRRSLGLCLLRHDPAYQRQLRSLLDRRPSQGA